MYQRGRHNDKTLHTFSRLKATNQMKLILEHSLSGTSHTEFLIGYEGWSLINLLYHPYQVILLH